MYNLHSGQARMIKQGAALMWAQSFTVETITETASSADDYYDVPTLQTGSTVLSGSYRWQPQERRRGSEGGLFKSSDLVLSTDILNSGAMTAAKTHLVVDGIRCSITTVAVYPEIGQIVVGAIRAV